YQEEEVTFYNSTASISLSGTLTIPQGNGPFPAVVLITGSGPENRDEEVFGHKPFLVLADHLTRNGIAVLRYDDRGVGSSEGTQAGATSADFATDTRAALDYLGKLKNIDANATGVLGHSEGGLIAMILASEYRDIDFIVLMAAPGTKGDRVMTDQSEYISRKSNIPDSTIAINSKMNHRIFEIIAGEPDPVAGTNSIDLYVREFLTEMYGETVEIDQVIANLHNSIGGAAYNWIRYFINSDPVLLLKM
ncbi:MAG: alpha/beta fold hydrolase, partial [Bacteroidales bacterium]